MIEQAHVNMEVFYVVLKAVLALKYYRQVFSVVRIYALHILTPLLMLVLVDILRIMAGNVDLLKVRARL